MKNKSLLTIATLLMFCAAMLRAPAQTTNEPPTPEGTVAALFGQMPESSSWSNTTIKIDVGVANLAIGQTGTAEAYLRGTYNLGSTFGIGLEGDFGANNVLDQAYLTIEAHKDLTDYAEIYAAGGGGYDFTPKNVQGFIGIGTRVIPIGSLPQVAIQAEVDAMINTGAGNSGGESTRILAGLTYHF